MTETDPPPVSNADDDFPSVSGFRLLQRLGEGAMGEVFLAEQREPVRRRVALKVVKRELQTRQVLQRFELERQALAVLSHDNIARVFDAGQTADGRAYFVMEFVPGTRLTEHCCKFRLSIEDRLELILQACAGVEHAHQKGIIHRDLKPSNILVSQDQGEAVVKIIDFGLARATDSESSDASLTQAGQFLGTPAYMSPEQAQLTPDQVDTRSDIYALGVILYEVLTGTLPFSIEALRTASFLEMQRMIVEVDPPRPSARIGAKGVVELAEARRTTASRLRKRLRGDLDWVVMKALAKEAGRRYATANELANDIRRFLRNEPVSAAAPSRAYVLSKFVRRNRVSVGAATLVLFALVAGTALAVWRWREARSNLALAERKTREAAASLKRAADSASRAERKSVEAKQALDLASQRLDDYTRMRDLPQSRQLLSDVRDLFPARRDRVEAMDAWLGRADRLRRRVETHHAKLEEVRARALPPTPEVQQEIDKLAALVKRRDERRDRRDQAVRDADGTRETRERLGDLESNVHEAENRVRKQTALLRDQRWKFADLDDQFQHSVLQDIADSLDRLYSQGGIAAEVKRWRERAATIERRSLEEHRDTWANAVAAIARSGMYRDMPALRPQLGLVPLGADTSSGFWEFAVLDTGVVPKRVNGELQLSDDFAIVLILIPPGTFWMGAQRTNPDGPNYTRYTNGAECDANGNAVRISLDAFFMGKYELTQGQWIRLTGENPSGFPAGHRIKAANRAAAEIVTLRHPVENMTWTACEDALRRVGLSLPTEAQWEYAARGGTTTTWWTGDDIESLHGAVNLADATFGRVSVGQPRNQSIDDGFWLTAPVGTLRANPYGLHNVLGNVREWCADGWCTYGDVPFDSGTGLQRSKNPRLRIVRGGCHSYDAPGCTSALRRPNDPNTVSVINGVRAARAVQ